ncbi:MAG: precorrin-8X methylmutase [Verrucomicrobia bacterium]|nr:precorrin-8X methylmutase [Verrucomicrobiota bacterium]
MSTSPRSPEYGIVIAGHGSRDPEGVREFEALVSLVKERVPARQRVTHGYLEFARPTIGEAVRANIGTGSRTISVVPAVLLAATHAKNDLPSEILALRQEFPGVAIHYGAPLHLHPLVLRTFRERVISAEARATRLVKRGDACLVVVGRGTTDPDANSDVSKLCRMLEEGLGFGASLVCYAGTARPSAADGLRLAARLGFPRMIVAPFLLFTGVLLKRIYAAAAEVAERHPELEVLVCDPLGLDAKLADAFLERAAESVKGKAAMNCSLCKYRVQIVGYEREVGAPQRGHHVQTRADHTRTDPAEARRVWYPPPEFAPHPIERRSFELIAAGRDWSQFEAPERDVLQRLVHTSGDFGAADDAFFSAGAVDAGVRALRRRAVIITDVTMVESGLRRTLLARFGLETFCAVHEEETRVSAEATGMTRSAAGIRRAWEKFGNHVVLAIGDAPTAVEETVHLVQEHRWRPQLVIALPVGFVGTRECKERLRRCVQVPRITNRGTRGGSPWAAAVLNALLIRLASTEDGLS